jgi:HK97 family phage portal protein
MALNGFAKDFFENGANMGGVVESTGNLSDQAFKRFKESWEEAYTGITKFHKTAFLEDGAKYNRIDQKLSEAQALESRKFAVIEICRTFGVPPHKVFDLEHATFSNIEHQNIEYVQESIMPMSVRNEQTIYKDCLVPIERKTLYAKFNVNALLRGDIAARTTYNHNMRQDGIMNPDEVRELEEMDAQPDGQGKIYASNGNMIPNTSIPQNLPKGAK